MTENMMRRGAREENEHSKKLAEHDRIWNAAIEAAANKVESAGNILLAHSVRELKK